MKDLPSSGDVLATRRRVVINLLSCRLICVADLVVDAGKSNARGRPRKGAGGPRQRHNLTYELHIFDQEPPLPISLDKDLRVLALGQALPENMDFDADEVGVKSLTIRHMLSGEHQTIEPGVADGADVLESLIRSFREGQRVGAYSPRMACGWDACGDCEYRANCFAESGLMVAVNPPMESQIHADQEKWMRVSRHLLSGRRSKWEIGALRQFLSWMVENPELDPQRALWLLAAAEKR
jgi:hypothetical protein